MSEDVGKIDFNELYVLLLDASRKAFRFAQEAHPDETFYTFGFYYRRWEVIVPIFNTEQAHMSRGHLTEAERDNKTLEWAYTRWAPMDWKYYDYSTAKHHFEPVTKWLGTHLNTGSLIGSGPLNVRRAVAIEGFIRGCLKTLKMLDKEGVFGHDKEREDVVLILRTPLASISNRYDHLEYASVLNPLATYQRWRVEWELHEHARDVLSPERFDRNNE